MVFGSDFLTKILSVLSFRLGMVFSDKRSPVTLDPRLEYSKTFFGLLQEPSSLTTDN